MYIQCIFDSEKTIKNGLENDKGKVCVCVCVGTTVNYVYYVKSFLKVSNFLDFLQFVWTDIHLFADI